MKKGVSPLIASVFLIVLVVSIASLVTTWMTQLVKDTEEEIGQRATASIECSNAAITVENVFVGEGSANIIARNSGLTDDLSIISAQIFDLFGNNFSAVNLPIADFDRGDIENILFTDPQILCTTFSQATINTDCGSVSESFTGTPECI